MRFYGHLQQGMIHKFLIEFDDDRVDPKVAKNLRDHLRGATVGRQQRRNIIDALVKSSTGDTATENLSITKL